MTERKERTAVVIGAGVAGLAAARHLVQAGFEVIVLEKNSYAGGRVRTDTFEGFEIEVGAQFMANFYDYTKRLIRELSLQQDVANIPKGAAIFRAGHLHKIWPSDPSLLFTGLISSSSKITLLKALGPLLQYWQKLDIHAPYKAHSLDTRSIADYAHQELNDELLEYLFQPPTSGILYWAPEHASQAMLFLLFKILSQMKLFTLHHGLGQLPKAMASNLDVYYNAEATKVISNESTTYVAEARINGKKRQFVADGIVCATPATVVSTLFADLDAEQQNFFNAVKYSSTVSASVGLDCRLSSDFYGIFYPRREIEYLAAVDIQSAKDPVQTPAGHDLIGLFSSGPAGHELLDKDDTIIQARLLGDLRKTGFSYDLDNHILFSKVHRWHQALPEFDVGHLQRLKAFVDGRIEPGHVVFAGDYIGGPFIEGAITSGLEAAQRLVQRLSSDYISQKNSE